tara:strand:- start:22275 stop:25028 length:2754 start_codon:yes stop_codon:yes gene_type:complete
MGWRRQLRKDYRQNKRQARRDIRAYKKGIRNNLSSGDYNQEQLYRDEEDGMVYDEQGYICPGLVRYGGVRPGIQYQGGGIKSMLQKHGSAGGGMLGLKNLNLGKGVKANISGGLNKFTAGIKKTFSGRNLSLSGSGSYNKGNGFGAKLGLTKRFQMGGEGIYSPESRAARHARDAKTLKAIRLAEERHSGKGMGTTAGIAPKLKDWIAAEKSEEYAKAQRQAARYMSTRYQFGGMNMEDGGTHLKGGVAKPLPGGATEFVGQTHEEGGIMLDPQTEVEDKETMDKVKGKDYFFSSHLKLGGKSFAARHKDLLKAGASQKEIDELARVQEIVAGRDEHSLDDEKEKKHGGVRKYQDAGFISEDQEDLDEEAKDIWEDPNGDHWNWDDARRASHQDYHFHEDGTPRTDEEKSQWKLENGMSSGDTITNQGELPAAEGYLYNGVTEEDIAPYLDEIYDITGIPDFNARNPEHVKALQQVMINPTDELRQKYPTYFSNTQGDMESDYLSGDKTVHSSAQNDDGLFGRDTLNAVMLLSESQEEIDDEEEIIPEPETETPGPELGPEGCPCEDGSMSEECCDDEDDEDDEEEDENSLMYNKPKKKFPWDTVLGVGAGLAQLIPAYMAMKEKPDFMGAPGRVPKIHLDRIAYNDARAENSANFHGMSRFLENSGLGPGAIANKMAAWGRKQEGDVKIGSQENRENIAIGNQEAQLNLQRLQNQVKNNMFVNEFNAGASAANKDRKLMGVQNAVQTLANMNRDRMGFKTERYVAGATAGGTGVLSRYNKELQFRKANPHLQVGSADYKAAWLDAQKNLQSSPESYYQEPKKRWWKFWDKEEDPVNLQEEEEDDDIVYEEVDDESDDESDPNMQEQESEFSFSEDTDNDTVPDYLQPDMNKFGGPRFGTKKRKKLRRKKRTKQIYG